MGLLFLCGCATGAMRIDVEVYKGPLAQTSESQFASLVGYLEEAQRSIVENMNFTLAIVANAEFEKLGKPDAECSRRYLEVKGVESFLLPLKSPKEDQALPQVPPATENKTCTETIAKPENGAKPTPHPKDQLHLYIPQPRDGGSSPLSANDPISWCNKLDPEGWYDQLPYFDCTVLRSVFSDSRHMLQQIHTLHQEHLTEINAQKWDTNEWRTRALLMDVGKIASEFRATAFRWAVANAGGQSPSCKTRIALVNFVMTASEFGNQLQTRSDVLLKQLSLSSGHDAKELSLSTHLQDTEPTDFIHLYDWLDASTDSCVFGGWFARHLIPGYPDMNVTNRVKIVKRLYGDHFWSKINTVHASGVGKVNQVFVKDGIGNWSLKSFENHPGELLDAYLNIGKQALKAAATVAAATSGVGSGGAAITAALKYADQSIAGPATTTSGKQIIEDLQQLEVGLRSDLGKQATDAQNAETAATDNDKKKEIRLKAIEEYTATITAFKRKIDVLTKTLQPAPDSKDTEAAVKKMLNSGTALQ